MSKTNKKSSREPTAEEKRLARAVKLDGWSNVITGLGVAGKDKRMGATVEWQKPQEQALEAFYAGSKMARKICDRPIDDALKKGWKLVGLEPDQIKLLTDRLEVMEFPARIAKAKQWSRLYGGAAVFAMTDGGLVADPYRPGQRILSFVTLHRFELYPMYEDLQKDILQPNYEKALAYTFFPRFATGNAMTKIHASRLLIFDGLPLPKRLWVQNQYWGDSVLSSMTESIRDYEVSNSSCANMITDFSVAVFKIKNLAQQIGADQDDSVLKRMEIVNLTRSIARAIMLDADGEEYKNEGRPVTGISELLDKVETRLVAESEFPHTVLFGDSPEGMGGSGRHEQDYWYDYLESIQEHGLKPQILKGARMVAAEMGMDVAKLDVEFEPLYQLDMKEEVEAREKQSATDQRYWEMGVMSSSQIAKNRFGGKKYSIEGQLSAEDLELVQDVPAPAPFDPSQGGFDSTRTDSLEGVIAPAKARSNAQMGLDLRARYGRGGNESSVLIARAIAEGRDMTKRELEAMVKAAKSVARSDSTKTDKDKGPASAHISALLWGGSEGVAWAKEELSKISDKSREG